jgi:hypothetical protein
MDNMEVTQNENVNVDDDIDVQIEDQTTEATQASSQEDELEKYTKSVSKRVNKLNDRIKQEAERAAYLEQQLLQKEQQVQALTSQTAELNTNLFAKEEEALASKEREADQLYRKAVEASDAELLSKADTLKSDIAIQKEKIRLAKQRQEQLKAQPAQQQQQQVQYQQQPQQQEVVEPTKEALGWYENNKWYGDSSDPQNAQATQFAYFTHFNLVNEGFEPDSDDYYEELNNRVYKVYPNLQQGEVVEKSEDKPAVQRVASASVGSRQQTQGKRNGVTFSKSEIERLRGLKPYNMSEDQWLKRVAKEKMKAQQKGA